MRKSKKINISTVFVIIILLCSIGAAGFFGYKTLYDEISHKQARDEYQNITVEYTKPVSLIKTEIAPEETAPLYPERDIDWNALKGINKDYIGWLYFPFTGNDEEHSFTIDYPMVYENYKNQYLRTTFEGEYNPAGAIFMDIMSNPSFYGYNDIIYGHHMRDNSMFGALELVHQMDDLDYLKENPQFLYVYTDTACHVYTLIGYEQVKSSDNIAYAVAYDNKAYDQIKDHIKSLDTYMESDLFTWKGRPEILNLSTCDGGVGTNKRFILHFAKIRAYPYADNGEAAHD